MFGSFGAKLPAPTQFLIDLSHFLGSWWWALLLGGYLALQGYKRVTATPKGREMKHRVMSKLPIIGNLTRKINVSRFAVPTPFCSSPVSRFCVPLKFVPKRRTTSSSRMPALPINRTVSSGGQLSEVIATQPYFPNTVKHMMKAGEQLATWTAC